jgi:N utilization substance protein A
VDIDLRVLKLMETEKGIPFDELVEIIEQAIPTAYQKHMIQAEPRVAPVKNPKSAT